MNKTPSVDFRAFRNLPPVLAFFIKRKGENFPHSTREGIELFKCVFRG
jgi:hypothetical protein